MMDLPIPTQIYTDVLVIGGGGAGLRAAIAAIKHGAKVVLLSQDGKCPSDDLLLQTKRTMCSRLVLSGAMVA